MRVGRISQSRSVVEFSVDFGSSVPSICAVVVRAEVECGRVIRYCLGPNDLTITDELDGVASGETKLLHDLMWQIFDDVSGAEIHDATDDDGAIRIGYSLDEGKTFTDVNVITIHGPRGLAYSFSRSAIVICREDTKQAGMGDSLMLLHLQVPDVFFLPEHTVAVGE